jgi:hypothetical protein
LEASGALVVKVGLAEERLGVDIDLRAVGLGSIVGVAVGAVGPLAGARIVLEPLESSISAVVAPTTVTGKDGSFSLSNLTPGTYVLRGTTALSPEGYGSANIGQIALMTVSIDSSAAQSVSMVFSTGRTITGQISAIGMASLGGAPYGSWSVAAKPVSRSVAVTPTPRSVRVRPDGSFRIDGLFPEEYVLDVLGLPAGATIEAAIKSGRAGLDRSIDLTDKATVGLDLTVSSGSTVSGRLLGPDGENVQGYSIILFPAAAPLRHPWHQLTKLVRTTSDGAFSFASLPSGEYLLCVFMDVGTLPDLAFLKAAEALAVKVSVARSSKVVQNLAVTGK